MRFPVISLVFFALAALTFARPVPLYAVTDIWDGRATLDFSGTLGYEDWSADGLRPSQFQAYRDVPRGFVLSSLHLYSEWTDPENPYYIKFFGRDLFQEDQVLGLQTGLYGVVRIRLGYKETPRLFSTGDRFLEGYAGDGRYTINPQIPETLQGFGTPIAPFQDDPAFRNALNGFLKDDGHDVDLKFIRKTSTAECLMKVADDLNFRLNYTHEDKDGTKLTSFGTYDQNFLPASSFQQFRVVLFEMPEPIDWSTNTVRAGLELNRDEGLAQLTYEFQDFSNGISALRWDNPFVSQDLAPGSPADPRLYGLDTAHGLISLPPDSYSQMGTLSGTWMLPFWKSRASWTLSGGGTWQNEGFAPFSQNTLMSTDIPNGRGGFLLANDPSALPARSLGGSVLNFTQNYQLTMRPLDALQVTAKYRYYYYDNKTTPLPFYGYSANGDSDWFTLPGGAQFENPTPGYLRQNASLDFDYSLSGAVSLRSGWTWERWRRWERDVSLTDEQGAGAGITLKPSKWLKVMVDYKYSVRDADGYIQEFAIVPEDPGLRQWDEDDRKRHAASTRALFSLLPGLSLEANGTLTRDSFDTDRLGLKGSLGWTAGTEMTYAPVSYLTVSASYGHRDDNSTLYGGSQLSALSGPDGPFFTDANLLYTSYREESDEVGLGVSGDIIPGVLTFSTGYNCNLGKIKAYSYNPYPRVPGDSINSSLPSPIDDTKVRDQEVRAGLEWRFTKNLSLNVQYLFEAFRVDDPMMNGLGNQVPDVYQDGQVYMENSHVLLLNSQYSNYTAHLGRATLTYRF
ncbi:MAG: MtrB/PioB family outer membrane beta-barrel protein [Nitrospirota bacterium]